MIKITEIKIGIKVLKKDELPDNEPIMIAPDEKFEIKLKVNKNTKDGDFDILCLPSLSGIAIYGIQDNIAQMSGTLSEIEVNNKEKGE